MFMKRLIVVAVSCALVSTAHADVSSEMQSWFNELGGSANVTPAAVVKGQTSTVYTGGNLYMRTPVRNYQLYSINPPKINAGCGGIDMFAGSFSFINSEQLTALLRNVANNAVGYAFMTAVKSISPDLADNLQYLQDQAAKMNNLNLNSCQMAEGIVTATASALTDKKEETTAQGTGSTLSNLWPDSLQSWDSWKKDKAAKKQARTAAANADAALKDLLSGGNVTWKALQKIDAPDSIRELMMSMIGTVIIVPVGENYGTGLDNTNGTKALWKYVGATDLDLTTFVGTQDQATTSGVTLLSCGTDTANCYSPLTLSNQTVASLAYKVSDVMTKATTKIMNRQAQSFTQLDQAIFTNTAVPVWRLATVAAMGRGADTALNRQFAQTVALDLAYAWFREMSKNLQSALSNAATSQAADQSQAAKELNDRINVIRQAAATQYMAQYQKASAIADVQRQTQWVHQTMMSAMPVNLQRSMFAFNR